MRKVLSFVLVLTLVLSSFSMAFAATPAAGASGLSDIDGSANADAIQVAYDLGIVTGNPDGTFLPEKAVTRAEFAAMITRAMAIPESALAGYTATTFKDTTGYGWAVPYLAFCQSKGILLGDGAGNVMPGRTINTNEAMTMILRAIGYTSNSSQLVGTWPANYVTIAQNVGLYDDVAAVVNVDKANAAQIIYNALTVQKVAVNSDGETKYLTQSDSTAAAVLLNTGLGCDTVTNKVLGTDGYSYDDSKFNIVKDLGAHGDAYVDGSDVMAFTSDSTALTGHLDGDKFKVGDVKYSFGAPVDKTSPAGAYILNGADQNSAAMTIGTAEGLADNGDVTINVDLSGKTIKEIYSIVVWDSNDGGKATTADLSGLKDDAQLFASDFDTNDDDTIKANSFQLVGAKSLDDIKADDVVYIYTDGDYIRKVAVGNETVTGEVSEIDGSDVTVNGKAYTFYDNTGAAVPFAAVDSGSSSFPAAGDDVTLTLDAYGKVFDVDSTAKADTYGVIEGSDIVAAGSLNDSRLKLYTSTDEEKTFDLAGGSDMTWTPAGNPWATGGANATVGAIVKYGLDKDGVINKIETNRYTSAGAASVTLSSVSLINIGATPVTVAKDVVVFVKDNSTGDYSVTPIANVDTYAQLNGFHNFCYVLNSDGEVSAMVIDSTNASASKDDIYAVVGKVTDTTDANGDPVQRVIGFAGGAALDKKTNFDSSYAAPTTVDALSVFKFQLDADGLIKSSATAITGGYHAGTISAINDAKDTITLGTTPYALADGVKVYEAVTKNNGTEVDYYKVSSVNNLRAAANYTAHIYDMVDDSDNRGAEVVVFVKY